MSFYLLFNFDVRFPLVILLFAVILIPIIKIIFYKGESKKEFLRKIVLPLILGLIISSFVEITFDNNNFDINLIINANRKEIHPAYPKLSNNSRIRIYFPSETKEKEITFSNEIILKQIPKEYRNQNFKIELIDNYWKLEKDSILIKSGVINLKVTPNDKLSQIKGTVRDLLGNRIEGALVKTDEDFTKTNASGKFIIQIPPKERKVEYIIRVEKEGFIPQELEYVSGDLKEIRLRKI